MCRDRKQNSGCQGLEGVTNEDEFLFEVMKMFWSLRVIVITYSECMKITELYKIKLNFMVAKIYLKSKP
jgi:hypothetical protein